MTDIPGARKAAEELGAALARAGCRLLVYSREFIEGDVVKGFASVDKAPKRSIIVRAPAGSAAAQLPEFDSRPDLFDPQADPHAEWEASFYRSLREVDGVLLIGGGQAVVITGHLALGYRLPLFTLASFGGAAMRVWKAIVPDRDLSTRADTNLMARTPWAKTAAAESVRSLLAQHERRHVEIERKHREEQADRRATARRSALACLVFLLAIASLPLGFWAMDTRAWLFQVLLFFSGCPAGASGATLRALWSDEAASALTLRTAVLGLAAGGISVLPYVLAQVASHPALIRPDPAVELPASSLVLLGFTVFIGFIAGFTFDAVYRKLAQADVARTKRLAVINDNHRQVAERAE